QAPDANLALGLDLRDHCAVSADVLVLRKTDAMTAAFAPLPVIPPSASGGRLDNRARPRVAEPMQAIVDRVFTALRGQLVDERFDREDVRERSERAQRRGAQRHGEQSMRD